MHTHVTLGAFSLSRLPHIEFGPGKINQVPDRVAEFGPRVLVVTGSASFVASPHWAPLLTALAQRGCAWEHMRIAGEPTPHGVDEAVARYRGADMDVVLGIGGGSVLDAAKAIAGLLPHGNSVLDHLEGVGRNIPYHGPATPYIAVPTTAGTGSEATKNAVLSIQGPEGYKKSFRHDCLVPQYAIVDPTLLATCPAALMAANGMDALTQLLESYVSSKAHALSDTLAWSGLQAVKDGLFPAWRGDGEEAAQGRGKMAYGALLSGITLTQVGLGAVHGLAAPLGAYFPIPHGVCCGTLLAAATEVNIRALRERAPEHPALDKYAALGTLLSGRRPAYREAAWDALVETLARWTDMLELPRLSHYQMRAQHLNKVVANSRGSSMQTNPIVLTDSEILEIVQRRL